MPAPKAKPKAATNTNDGKAAPPAAPAAPSSRTMAYRGTTIQLQHPDNWKPVANGTNLTIAPTGGADERGNLGYGMIIDVFKPQNARSLDEATNQLVDMLRQGNPNMKVTRSRVQTRVDGRPAQLTELANDSPFGGTESDVVVTVFRTTTELQFFVWVAPTKAMSQYQPAFQNIMGSVRMN
jgi:hypothetical protein